MRAEPIPHPLGGNFGHMQHSSQSHKSVINFWKVVILKCMKMTLNYQVFLLCVIKETKRVIWKYISGHNVFWTEEDTHTVRCVILLM